MWGYWEIAPFLHCWCSCKFLEGKLTLIYPNKSLWWTFILTICDSFWVGIKAFPGKVALPTASEEWHMTLACEDILFLWPQWLMNIWPKLIKSKRISGVLLCIQGQSTCSFLDGCKRRNIFFLEDTDSQLGSVRWIILRKTWVSGKVEEKDGKK